MNLPNIRFDGGTITSNELNQAYDSLKVFNNKKITKILVCLKNTNRVLQPSEIQQLLGSDSAGFDQSAVSQKLAQLRGLNIVNTRRKAKNVFYDIRKEGYSETEKLNNSIGLKTLRALRHVLRVSMLNMISEIPGMNVTELLIAFRLDQSVASLHLGILRRANLVFSIKNGKNSKYYIITDNLKIIGENIKTITNGSMATNINV